MVYNQGISFIYKTCFTGDLIIHLINDNTSVGAFYCKASSIMFYFVTCFASFNKRNRGGLINIDIFLTVDHQINWIYIVTRDTGLMIYIGIVDTRSRICCVFPVSSVYATPALFTPQLQTGHLLPLTIRPCTVVFCKAEL